ncbi:MAG: isoprenylcysteine carboxylmethyltransferase family protein [Bacteroidetes bacterium]|nr:isoprenylcysteine carboxylmethyltransferase family protein [Bacteroidota bacterium]
MNKHLAIKTILGFLNLLVMMGLSIFIPPGTLHYNQAWYYLVIFFGGALIITVYVFINDKNLLQSRLQVGSMAEKRRAQKIIQGIASAGFIGMYIISGFDQRCKWSDVPGWLWIFSDALLISAMILLFVIFRKNTSLSATIEVKEQQQIVTDGPYSVVRHPMYSAAVLLFLFTPLSLGSYWALLTLPLMIMVLILRSLDEEKVLREELHGYTDYCKKVRYRLIPCIW